MSTSSRPARRYLSSTWSFAILTTRSTCHNLNHVTIPHSRSTGACSSILSASGPPSSTLDHFSPQRALPTISRNCPPQYGSHPSMWGGDRQNESPLPCCPAVDALSPFECLPTINCTRQQFALCWGAVYGRNDKTKGLYRCAQERREVVNQATRFGLFIVDRLDVLLELESCGATKCLRPPSIYVCWSL